MSPRTGRPRKINPRDCDINIRLTKQELENINQISEKMGITRTDAIVKGIDLLKAEYDK